MSSSRTRIGSYFLEKTGLVKTCEDPIFQERYARARVVLKASRAALANLKAWQKSTEEVAKRSAAAFEAISRLFGPSDGRGGRGLPQGPRRLNVVHEAGSEGSGRSVEEEIATSCRRETLGVPEGAADEAERSVALVAAPPRAEARIARILKRVNRAKDEIEGVLVPVFREHVIQVLEEEVETNTKAVDSARTEEKAARRSFQHYARKWIQLRKAGTKSCKPDRLDRNAEKLRSARERYTRALRDATIAVQRATELNPLRLSKLVLRMLQFDLEISRTRIEVVGPALSNSRKLVRESS